MLLVGYETWGKLYFSFKSFEASPVGRWTSRSAISIMFLISLLLILPRKRHTLSCRRFKISQKSWIFGEKRNVAAALHSNPTFYSRHVNLAVFICWDERRAVRTTFPQGVRVGGGSFPPLSSLPPLQLQVTSLTPPRLTGATWRRKRREEEQEDLLKLVMFPPTINSLLNMSTSLQSWMQYVGLQFKFFTQIVFFFFFSAEETAATAKT